MLIDLGLYVSTIAVACAIFIVAQYVTLKILQVKPFYVLLTVLAGASAIAGSVITWLLLGENYSTPGGAIAISVAGASTFWLLAVIYLLLGPISVDRSISAHIVILLSRSADGQMDRTEFMSRYTEQFIYEKRFKELSESQIVQLKNKNLVLTKKGVFIAKIYERLIQWFGLSFDL